MAAAERVMDRGIGNVTALRGFSMPPMAPPRPCPLVDDTVYRRTRRAVTEAFHAVDDLIHEWRRSRHQILFEAASPMSLAVFEPVLARLQTDDRLDFWFTTSDAAWGAADIFGGSAVAGRVLPASRARRMKFDAYINTDFWSTTWLRRRTRRVHFFHGVAGKYGLDAPTRIAPVIASFDRLMFANSDRLQRYSMAGLVDPRSPKAALIGYPKVDCLVDGSIDEAAVRKALGFDNGRATVLYAPTWSPHSSLNSIGVDVIQALVNMGVNVLVKLHDRSLDRTTRGAGGIDWRAELARFGDRGVRLADGANAAPYMCAADVMVTDHSSIGFEYMLLDRPILILDCPRLISAARISADKVERLRRASDVVMDAAALPRALAAALDDPARNGDIRRATAAEFFYRPGGASARAATTIYELLEIPEPTARMAVSGARRG
jgi:hypothetical protein